MDDAIAAQSCSGADATVPYKNAATSLDVTSAEPLDQQPTANLGLLYDIASIANACQSFDAALKATLQRLCRNDSWVLAKAWQPTNGRDFNGCKVAQFGRHSGFSIARLDAAAQLSGPDGNAVEDPLVAQVLRDCQALWLSPLQNIPAFRAPGNNQLRTAVAAPVISHRMIVAVLEIFSDDQQEPDPQFLETLRQVSSQLGHVYQRKLNELEIAFAAEADRHRIAQEMHDGLSQQIAGIAMLTGSLADTLKVQQHPSAEKATRLLIAIESAKQQARRISKELMLIEPTAAGLRAALEELADETHEAYDVSCQLDVTQVPFEIDKLTATQLYRIIQEAVLNSIKHAHARRIWIDITSANGLSIVVRDDGAGCDPDQNVEHSGLRVMRHRAELIGATLTISPVHDGGTVVTCTV
jgi:signal transduction histidine kinase